LETTTADGDPLRSAVPKTRPGTACRNPGTGTVSRTIGIMTAASAYDNSGRQQGYGLVLGRGVRLLISANWDI
jgi:hypothetical protein